jgi:hypothetical protein
MGSSIALSYEVLSSRRGAPALQRVARALSILARAYTMTATKTKPIEIARRKIARAVKLVLPRGRTFNIKVEDSALGGMKVVRVVTTAWKDLRPAERISRVRGAVEQVLSQDEQDKILRFSVLTPGEYKSIWNAPFQRRTAHSRTRLNTRQSPTKAGVHRAKSVASAGERKELVENGALASKPTG